MNERFHRQEFERAEDPRELASALAHELTERMRASTDRTQEIAAIVAHLRILGHDIYSWDESDDYAAWGDSYVEPTAAYRILVEFVLRGEPQDDAPFVEVTFGPWPTG